MIKHEKKNYKIEKTTTYEASTKSICMSLHSLCSNTVGENRHGNAEYRMSHCLQDKLNHDRGKVSNATCQRGQQKISNPVHETRE